MHCKSIDWFLHVMSFYLIKDILKMDMLKKWLIWSLGKLKKIQNGLQLSIGLYLSSEVFGKSNETQI